jgi:hypothetical protein
MNWEVENLNEMEATKDEFKKQIIYIWDNLVLQMKANTYKVVVSPWSKKMIGKTNYNFFLINFF